MTTNQSNQSLDAGSMYGIKPCPGNDCTHSPNRGYLPTLEEIASYNYVNPVDPTRRPPEQALNTPVQEMVPKTPAPMSPMQGMPQGGNTAQNPLAPITSTTQPPSISGDSLQYLNGFMRTQIGRTVVVEFLVGANTLVDRTGILLAVGSNYILLNEVETDDILACDFYNIKFIRFYY